MPGKQQDFLHSCMYLWLKVSAHNSMPAIIFISGDRKLQYAWLQLTVMIIQMEILTGYHFFPKLPASVTPPVPGYPNGYAAYGGTTAEILRLFFGTDQTSIDITTTSINPAVTEPKPSFHFSSFSQAARDNSLSMIYNGWDFRKSVLDGEEMGRQIAAYVFTHAFREE